MQGAEPLPTDSPSAAAAEPSSRRAAQRMVRENLHTNVLGRGDGDIESNTSIGNTTASASTNASEAKSGGWFGVFGGNSNEAEEVNNVQRKRRNNNARYNGLQQSLEEGNYDPPPLEGLGSSSSVATDSLATATEATTATREDRVRQDSSIFFQGVDEESAMPYHRTKSGRKGGRTVAKSNRMLHNMAIRARLSGEVDGALFMSRYERLNQVMDPTKRKKNKARHLRGQQYMGTDNSSNNDENINHDLFLDENDDGQSQPSSYREHIPSPTNNVVMGATSLVNPHGFRSSSMFFEQDGKMLMRLPRDQVRLVMDYNLEPGILSVEQWRSQEDAQIASEKLAARNARTKEMIQRQKEKERRHRRRERERRRRRRRKLQKLKQKQATAGESKTGDEEVPLKTVPLEESKEAPSENDHDDDDDDSYSSYSDDNSSYSDDDSLDQDLLPELKYVITIPDDLYRRMVAEMSAKLMPPYWGFLKCFHQESGRADIRLALVILAVVMSLLFVGSLEWRTT